MEDWQLGKSKTDKNATMKVKMTITVELSEHLYGEKLDEDQKLWLENIIFVGDGSLVLHSNEIGDEVGVVKLCRNIQFKEE